MIEDLGLPHFHWLDYTVILVILITLLLVGVFAGWRGRNSTSANKFLTSRGEMHWAHVSFSVQSSSFSAILLLSVTSEIYAYGSCYSYIILSYFISQPLVAHLYIPVYNKLNILSIYEYLEKRYNSFVKICASVLYAMEILLFFPIILFVPALALSQVTGFPILWSILFCGIVCTLYTCLGGMKATVWNDTLQMVLIFVGLTTIIGMGFYRVGGWNEFIKRNQDGHRFVFNEFRFDPTLRTTFWTQIFGGIIIYAKLSACNQTLIQKFLSAKSMKEFYKSLYFTLIGVLLIMTYITIIGLLCYAYYYNCDPLTSGRIEKLDQIVPLFVMEITKGYPGLPGLFLVTAFSASISSMSGGLNGLSAVILDSFIDPLFAKLFKTFKDKYRIISTRILIILLGSYTTIMAHVAQSLDQSTVQISFSISGTTGGPMFAMTTLGMLCPFVNVYGCIVGFVAGLAVGFWMSFGALLAKKVSPMLPLETYGCLDTNSTTNYSNFSSAYENFTLETITSSPFTSSTYEPSLTNEDDVFWLYKVSFFYHAPITFVVSCLVSIVVSVITGGNKNVNQNLLFFCMRKKQDPENHKNEEPPAPNNFNLEKFQMSVVMNDNESSEQ